ncbi:MAG: hypothetical protein IT438_07165 [Phycisphaerales bacterium]|nr:hypothetical protein [Phycisphaerales bacterium]
MSSFPLSRLSVAAVLAAAAFAQCSFGQGQPAAPERFPGLGEIAFPRGDLDPTNAALLYYKVWIDPVFRELKDPCGEQLNATDPNWKPDAALSKQLREHQGYIAVMLRATQAPACDFGIEWSQGIGAMLPHLGYLRGSARILACDARRCIAEGRFDDASERIAAIYRMSRHVSGDGVLISGLVSVAIAGVANNLTYGQMSGTSMTVAGKELILREARRTLQPDAFGVKHGIDGERRWTSDWLRGFAKGPKAGAMIAAQILPLASPDEDATVADAIRKMTESEVGADLDKGAGFYTDVLAAWDRDDTKDRLKEIEAAMERGDYGVIAKVLCPALNKAHRSDEKARAEQDALVKKLEGHIALSR